MKITNISIYDFTGARMALRALPIGSDIRALAQECLLAERSAARKAEREDESARLEAALEWQRQDRRERNKWYR